LFTARKQEYSKNYGYKLHALCGLKGVKQQVGLFALIISKGSAMTVLQHINFINNKPIGQIKHALL